MSNILQKLILTYPDKGWNGSALCINTCITFEFVNEYYYEFFDEIYDFDKGRLLLN